MSLPSTDYPSPPALVLDNRDLQHMPHVSFTWESATHVPWIYGWNYSCFQLLRTVGLIWEGRECQSGFDSLGRIEYQE